MKKGAYRVLLSLLMLITLTACNSGEPTLYNAPKGALYEGLYEMNISSGSAHYERKDGIDTFSATMKWAPNDENVDYAEYTDEYYLEWTSDELTFPYEVIEPNTDMSVLRNNKYTVYPGDNIEVSFDFDTYFDGIPQGYIKFIKVFDVYYKDGTQEQMVTATAFDLS